MSESRIKLSDKLSLVLASLALMLSFATSYAQFIHRPNNMLLALDRLNVSDGEISATAVFVNHGEQPNAVIAAEIIIASDSGLEQMTIRQQQSPQFEIGPGEVKQFLLQAPYSYEDIMGRASGDRRETHVGLRLIMVTQDGTLITGLYRIGSAYPQSDRRINFSSGYRAFDALDTDDPTKPLHVEPGVGPPPGT